MVQQKRESSKKDATIMVSIHCPYCDRDIDDVEVEINSLDVQYIKEDTNEN